MAKRELDPASQVRQLCAELEKGSPLRGYIFKGEERFFSEQGLEAVQAAAKAKNWEVVKHDGGDPDFQLQNLLGDLQAVSMFSEGTCVLVRRAEEPLKGGKDAPLARALVAFLKRQGQAGCVALSCSSMRADNVVAKATTAAGGRILSCRRLYDSPPPWDPDPRRAELVRWLVGRAAQCEVRLDPGEAAYVVAAVGNDLFALDGELEKIRSSGGKSVRSVVSFTSGASPFETADDITSGKFEKAGTHLESLFRGGFLGRDGKRTLDADALLMILFGTVRKQISQSLNAKTSIESGTAEASAARLAGATGSPQMVQRFLERTNLRSARAWRKMSEEWSALERRSRSGGRVDQTDLFSFALRWRVKQGARRMQSARR